MTQGSPLATPVPWDMVAPAYADEVVPLFEQFSQEALRVADGQALPFADATFDAGFSMFGLMFFPDRAKGFAELRRVLRPGAKALVSSWYPLDKIPLLAAMFGAVREAMVQATGSPPPAQQDSPLTSAESCRAEMSGAFTDVVVHELSVTQQAPSSDALWESFTRTMAPIVMMKKNLGDRFALVDEAARTAMRSVLGGGPAEMTLAAHLTVGTAR
jgi:ubiquinone/menaquinone biosynthesis C-methylase UbiE